MLIILSALLILAVVQFRQNRQAPTEGPFVDQRAPQFTLPLLGSQHTISLADLQDKPVVLAFWATWCGPCREEMPDLQIMQDDYSDRAHIILINLTNTERSVDHVAGFMDNFNYTVRAGLDLDGNVAFTYGVRSIPTTVIIDSTGMVMFRQSGPMTVSQILAALPK